MPGDKKLFTPGPLLTSAKVKEAMLRDLGSRDEEFMNIVKFIRRTLLEIAGVSGEKYTTVLVQGSGTSAVESVLQTVVPRNGKVLIIANGAYGNRMGAICRYADLEHKVLDFPEEFAVDTSAVKRHLEETRDYDAVCIVHCETSAGVLNPVAAVGEVVKSLMPNAVYIVDAMSSFGAVPVNFTYVDYLVSSANKCLEGVPGIGYVIAKRDHLIGCRGNSRSLTLDLLDQWQGLEKTGQFRFTPPTHVLLAFRQALVDFQAQGGVEARMNRYQENHRVLIEGMRKLGFRELVEPAHQCYVITSFHYPKDSNFNFETFYSELSNRDQVIYPGKLTNAQCFRIGNIGQLFRRDVDRLVDEIRTVCDSMQIQLPLL